MKKSDKLAKELAEKQTALKAKTAEVRAAAEKEDTPIDDVKAGVAEVTKLQEEIETIKSDIDTLKEASELKVDEQQDDVKSEEKDAGEDDTEEKKDEEEEMKLKAKSTHTENRDAELVEEKRDALNGFLHSKGEVRDGLKTSDVGVLIPEEIIYVPRDEINTVTDLSALVEKTSVTSASGKYPILKRASTTLPSVAELEKNPELAKPQFEQIDWSIETYRGALPLSQESISDSQIDLTGLVAKHIQVIKLNTTNAKIASVLSAFKKATVGAETLADDLKTAINTHFDVAYSLALVVTKSFYNQLDHLKDGEGRYILNNDVTVASGKSVFGVPLVIVEDTAFGGKVGAAQAFLGDLKRAVLFTDRLDIAVNWVDNDVYGKILQAVVRFDVKQADKEAGEFIDLAVAKASK